MRKWIKRITKGVLVVLLISGSVAAALFLRWRKGIVDHLEDGSTVVGTSRGPVEYATFGTGRPALYLHGSPGGFDQVYRTLRVLYGEAGPDFRAIIPSRPGYLRTPLSTGATPAEQADALAALLDVLGVPRAAVIAGSDGGPSAVQFALRHPGRCTALILQSAVTQRIADDPPPLYLRVLPTDFLVWAVLQVMELQGDDDPTYSALLREVMASAVPYARRRAGADNDTAQDAVIPDWPLQEIRCPTLILHGHRDKAVPFSQAEAAHARIPGSRLVRLDGGHLATLRRHKEVAAAIQSFLAEPEARLEPESR